MSGLPGAGYEGLALWPDELRHPYSFGAPILKLADFRGPVRALASLTPLLRPAGGARCATARPDRPGADDGGGAEPGSGPSANVNRPGIMTGNVTFFPKIQALVAGSSALRD